MSRQAVSKMVTGGTTESAKLFQIARFLQTTPEFLSGETDQPNGDEALADRRLPYRAPESDQQVIPPGMVMVTELDLALGLGGAFLDGPVEGREITFPEDWLRQFTKAPADLIHFVRGKGDSMYPTIMDGDVCLLDTSRRQIDEQDALWAVSFGDLGMIKRLRKMPDGTVKIMSDNEHVPAEVASDGELYIWARCCGVFRKV